MHVAFLTMILTVFSPVTRPSGFGRTSSSSTRGDGLILPLVRAGPRRTRGWARRAWYGRTSLRMLCMGVHRCASLCMTVHRCASLCMLCILVCIVVQACASLCILVCRALLVCTLHVCSIVIHTQCSVVSCGVNPSPVLVHTAPGPPAAEESTDPLAGPDPLTTLQPSGVSRIDPPSVEHTHTHTHTHTHPTSHHVPLQTRSQRAARHQRCSPRPSR